MPGEPETRPTLLIVEDIFFIRMMAEDYFEGAGFRTLSTSSAAEAIVLLETDSSIEYLFLDVNLPSGMNGQELAAVARKRWPPVKIILTSADTVADRITLPVRAAFIPKPYNLANVRQTFATM